MMRVELLVGLDLLDLGDEASLRAVRLEAGPELVEVGGRAHEREGDEVGVELGGEREVVDVLVGDRGQLGPRPGDVDALARGQRAGGAHARDDLALLDAVDREAGDAVADHDLAALGDQAREAGEVDHHAVVPAAAVAAEHDGLVELERARLGAGREAQLGTLQVEQQADRPAGAGGRLADLARAPAQVVVGAVRAVQPGAVQAGGDQLVELPGRVGGRPERGHDLRVPAVHAGSLAARRRLCRWA